MVRGTVKAGGSSRKKRIPRKSYKTKGGVRYKKYGRYSKYTKKARTVMKRVRKSKTHTIIASTDVPVGYVAPAGGNAGQVGTATAVMQNLITISARYHGVAIDQTAIVPLGRSDPGSLYTKFNQHLLAKHTMLMRDINRANENVIKSTEPYIEYRGVSIKQLPGQTIYRVQASQVPVPAVYYQHSDMDGMQPIFFESGRLYIKFSREVTGMNNRGEPDAVAAGGRLANRSLFPKHLAVFNVGTVKIKLYYRVFNAVGNLLGQNNAGVMNIDLAQNVMAGVLK